MRLVALALLGVLAIADPARADPPAAGGFLATMTYVKEHCPSYEVVKPKAVEIFHRLGHDVGDGRPLPPAMVAAANAIQSRLERGDPRDVCARIWNEFGTGGETFPDTLARK